MERETLKQAFRLNEYESSVLSFVFNHGELSIGEISKLSPVPRSRIYDVAETLRKKGFINIEYKGFPIKCESIPLKQMISNWERRLTEEVKDKISYCKKVLRGRKK